VNCSHQGGAGGFLGRTSGHFRSYRINDHHKSVSACTEEVSASSVLLLPHAPSSVSVARRRLGADLRAHGVPENMAGDAILVLSELLSNAIRHAHPLPGGQVRVSWSLQGGTLDLAVSDGGSPTRPHQVRRSMSALGGRGLAIVEHLSSGWGVRSDDQETLVWATLPTTANSKLQRRPRRSPARAQARPPAG
jgi:anti-sigma regulatory factor (Ser/Thr protein kinase)